MASKTKQEKFKPQTSTNKRQKDRSLKVRFFIKMTYPFGHLNSTYSHAYSPWNLNLMQKAARILC